MNNLLFENDIKGTAVYQLADQLMFAARTAPKAKGKDNLTIAKIGKDTIKEVDAVMKQMVIAGQAAEFFNRDAENILNCECVVLIGTTIRTLGVKNCGLCGFPDCGAKNEFKDVPCQFNSSDLGTAVGSAVSKAADLRLDNRIMFSVGKAVQKMGMLGEDTKIIYGIPLSSSGKNVFFDR